MEVEILPPWLKRINFVFAFTFVSSQWHLRLKIIMDGNKLFWKLGAFAKFDFKRFAADAERLKVWFLDCFTIPFAPNVTFRVCVKL